jgi:hypothetical protein
LNFNHAFETGSRAMSWDGDVLARLRATAVVAGVIGGLSLSGRLDRAAEPSLGHASPASREMMQLVRDEHELVANMDKAQLAVLDSNFDPKPIAAAEQRQVIALR